MKKLLLLFTLTAFFCGCSTSTADSAQTKHRKVAVQSYSFNRFTLEEAIAKVKDFGLDGLEVYPGHKISAKYPGVTFAKMNAEQKEYVKKLLKDANLKVVSYGVVSAKSEDDIKAIMALAKEMGIQRIITECAVATFPIWEKYGKETGIYMCLHNHAKDSPNKYYDPEVVAESIKGFDYVKASPDVGHWSRSQIKGVEGLKILKGSLLSMHFKDQAEWGNPKNQCVPLGEGQNNIKGMLAELDSQGYTGWFVIEYEADWDNNAPQIKKCVDYLRKN